MKITTTCLFCGDIFSLTTGDPVELDRLYGAWATAHKHTSDPSPLSIECPECCAAPGLRCHTTTRAQRPTRIHRARERRAARLANEGATKLP